MADKLDQKLTLITKLLLIVLCPAAAAAEGEWANAFELLSRTLKEVDPGGHALVGRIKTPVVTKEDLQRVFETGRAQGRAEEAAKRQRALSTITSLANNNAGDGYNGFSWREIVGYCLANRHRIRNAWEAETFLPSAAEQLANPYYELSAKQKPIVRRIFQTWFKGEIT